MVDVYFVLFEEYFRCSCNSLYAGEDKDNYNLDMSTQGKIVIWAFLYLSLSNRVCVLNLFRTLVMLTARIRKLFSFSHDPFPCSICFTDFGPKVFVAAKFVFLSVWFF